VILRAFRTKTLSEDSGRDSHCLLMNSGSFQSTLFYIPTWGDDEADSFRT
jgi:hypothetical protein